VRAAGLLERPAGVERGDHLCWAYDGGDAAEDAAFGEAAVRFLCEGLERGDRLLWVGDGAARRLRRSGSPLADVDELTARGTLRLLPLDGAYAAPGGFSPDQQLAFYGTATRRAIEAGFAGLRVVAEITGLAGDPERRAELLRWEHLADEYVSRGEGFRALCAYRRAELPGEAVTDLASLHPMAHVPGAAPPFRLWIDGGRIVVAGEVDTFGAERFLRTLATAPVAGPVSTLDLSRVDFLDLAACRALARWARQLAERSATLEVTGATRVVRRIWGLLDPAGTPSVTFRENRP
jgi:anti-anti-sigma regulatory factor